MGIKAECYPFTVWQPITEDGIVLTSAIAYASAKVVVCCVGRGADEKMPADGLTAAKQPKNLKPAPVPCPAF
jgi:hypothetical protein